MKQESWPTLSREQIESLRLQYFDVVNDGAYVFDFEDGRIFDVNKHLIEMLGYTREELLQLDVFDIHPEEERERMIKLIDIFSREGQIRGISDMHLKTKDGRWIPVEKNGTLFPLNGRKVIQCTCRDITIRKKAEEELKREQDFTQELIRTAKSIIITVNPDHTVRTVNPETAKILGYKEEDIISKNWFDNFIPVRFRDELKRSFSELLKGKISGFGLHENPVLTRSGREVAIQWSNNVIRDTSGQIIGTLSIGQDISERKRFEAELNRRIEDMHILNSIALEITSGLELGKLLPMITKSAVKLLNADAGGVGIYDPRKDILSYRHLYNLPQTLAHLEIPRGAGLTSYVLDTARPISIPDYLSYPKAIKEFKEAGMRGTVIAPLLVENRLLGTLVIVHTHPEKRFNEYDISLLEAVARQAAIAIYNAQLFGEMKDEGEFRQALNQLTSVIGATLDIDKVYDLMCEEGTKLFRNSGTYLYVVDQESGLLVGKAAYGEKAEDFLKVAIPIREPSLATYIYHTRKPVLIDDAESHPIVKPDIRQRFRSKTLMGVPVIVDGEVKSVLVFHSSERPYFFNETQLERAKILSNQIAFAIKNADLYEGTKKALEHERYVAVTLQRSLLPEKVPEIPGAEVGAYYAPTHAGDALIGGDFYDFIQLADGKVAIVIGDVSGKGIEAAAITAMVKYAIRSFIYKDPTPSYVLTQANNVVSMQLKLGSFVSLCYALYDPKTGVIDFANAGHPFPVHYRAAEQAYKLIETGNPVFGLIPNYAYNQVKEALAEGDILALYTDGLIEARTGRKFFGVDGAESSISKNHDLSAQEIAL
ncbi:MAG TPA: SpoIIE family protein phosphatase, partial [Anaerolineae bacterium]|nr:SpoIIE family protein phosphatase [Anaerolineae bacterium]